MDNHQGNHADVRRFIFLLVALLVWLVVQAVLPEGGWASLVQVVFVIICWGVAIWWFWSWFKGRME